ncbi:MAG: M3 family oligoendopeptidase [Vulcanimicrobiaceae bacterium]
MQWMADLSAPSDAEFTARYDRIAANVASGLNVAGWRAAFDEWDELRRTWKSWSNLTRLRYSQDTRRDDHRSAQATLDKRSPHVTSLDTSMKQRFIGSNARLGLEHELGAHAFALWEADVTTFDDRVAADLVRESELTRDYTELLATASVPFAGEERTLGALGPYLQSNDRDIRHGAERARWSAFADRAERLDEIFAELVTVRDRMARTLGFASFIELGYKRMRRVGYDAADVARYRDEVARVVVPLAARLVKKLGAEAGYDRVRFWDETSLTVGGPVVPKGDHTWVIARAREALAGIDPALGDFARVIFDRDLLDVANRPGKALGAYCTMFPTERVPFVFANFDGTRGDVRTLMHELGHAFQAYSSRNKVAIDYLTPTYESAEIHSMSLEYLSWPQMERFFGDDADGYRREHLLDAMLFLPYGVAVDHFQHLVYGDPSATAAQRHAMWRECERRYLPWRDYGDLAYPNVGGLWQEKRHIFVAPFYYIDYTLALCCALQLWTKAGTDRAATLADYVALCDRGGEASFGTLVASAGLRSPFEAGALADVVNAATAAF